MLDWKLSVCGLVVGILVGFTGMGGGSVMTAMLILLFGVHPATAVGTDLLFAALTKAVGTRVHSGKGNVAWWLVGLLAAGSVPGTMATLYVLSRLPMHDANVARVIKLVIGIALLVAALSLLLGRRLAIGDAETVEDKAPTTAGAFATVCLGAFLGILVSLTSVGAGALGIVFLRYLHPRMPSVRLVGSDIAHAVPLTLLAGSGHWLIGDVDWRMLLWLLAGSIPGIVIGSHFAHTVPEKWLRLILGVVLGVISISLIAS